MSIFHQRLRQLIRESGLKDSDVSKQVGRGTAYISNMINTEADPGFSVIIRICDLFDVTPDYFIGRESRSEISEIIDQNVLETHAEMLVQISLTQARKRLLNRTPHPSLDEVMNWWHRNRQSYDHNEAIAAFFDVYLPPDQSGLPRIVAVGRESLATRSIGVQSVEKLRTVYQDLGPDHLKGIVDAHLEAHEQKNPLLTVENINIVLPDKRRLTIDYKRLLLSVRTVKGDQFVINYSSPID